MLALVLAVIAVFTSILSGVVGMIGGIVLLSLMTVFLSWQVVIPVHGVVQLVSNGSRSFFLAKHIHRKIFLYFAIGAPLGALLSTFLILELQDPRAPLAMIVALIAYALFKPKKMPALNLPIPWFFALGFTAGFLGLLIGAVGPLLAPFLLRDDLSKEEIIGTQATCQTLTHFLKLPAFMYLGFNFAEHLFLISLMVGGALLGTHLGVRVLKGLNENVFRWIYRVALAAAALRLIYKIIFP